MWGKYNYLCRLLSWHSYWSWKNHPKSWKPQQNLGLFSPNKWLIIPKKKTWFNHINHNNKWSKYIWYGPPPAASTARKSLGEKKNSAPTGCRDPTFSPRETCFVSPSHLASCKHNERTKHEKRCLHTSHVEISVRFWTWVFVRQKKTSVSGCSEEARLLDGKKTRRGLLKSRAGADLPSGKLT